MLSEHQCQGWLEGYLLTSRSRHGFFSCYEAFIHIIDSMFSQRRQVAEGLPTHIPWRRPIGSLNYLLSSHVWRQDHNGFSHQDPGFIDHVINKKGRGGNRPYHRPCQLPPYRSPITACAAGTMSIIVVAGKQPAPQWVDDRRSGQAPLHKAGLRIWEWASNDKGGEPDVVMACCGG